MRLDNKIAPSAAGSQKTIAEACREKKIFRFSPHKLEEARDIPAGWYAFLTLLEDGKPIIYVRELIDFQSGHDGLLMFLKRIGSAQKNQMLSQVSLQSVVAAGEIIFGMGGDIVGWCFATGHHEALKIGDDSPRLQNRKLAVSLEDNAFFKVQDWIFLLGENGMLRNYFDAKGKYKALVSADSEQPKLTRQNLPKLRLFNRILHAHKIVLSNATLNALFSGVTLKTSSVVPVSGDEKMVRQPDSINHAALSDSVRALFPGGGPIQTAAAGPAPAFATPTARARRLVNVAPAPQSQNSSVHSAAAAAIPTSPLTQLSPPVSPVITPAAAVAVVVTGAQGMVTATAGVGAGTGTGTGTFASRVDEKKPSHRQQNSRRPLVNRNRLFGSGHSTITRGDGDVKVGAPLDSVDERIDPTNLAPWWCCFTCHKTN